MEITPRARAALDELLTAGYAEPAPPDNIMAGRESYRGTEMEPHIGILARDAGINVFEKRENWPMFVAKDSA